MLLEAIGPDFASSQRTPSNTCLQSAQHVSRRSFSNALARDRSVAEHGRVELPNAAVFEKRLVNVEQELAASYLQIAASRPRHLLDRSIHHDELEFVQPAV